jgi:alpha-glucuronidase
VVSDKDYTRGLIAMLRRNIPGSEILQVCGQEWERTFRKNKRIQPEAFERVKEILRTQAPSSKNKMDAVNGYRKISRTLQRTKRYE